MDTFPVGQVRLPFCMVCGSAPCTLRFVIRAPFEVHGRPAELVVIHPFLLPQVVQRFNEPSNCQVPDCVNPASSNDSKKKTLRKHKAALVNRRLSQYRCKPELLFRLRDGASN